METFEINLAGEVLMIHAVNDDTFQVYRDGAFLATLNLNIDEDTGDTVWGSADLIAPDYVKQIGELIEEHEM